MKQQQDRAQTWWTLSATLVCAAVLGAGCYAQSDNEAPTDVGAGDDVTDATGTDAASDVAADPVVEVAEPCISVTHVEGYDFRQRFIEQTHSTVFTIQNCAAPTTDQVLEVYAVEWLEEDVAISFATLPGSLPNEQLVLNPGESADFVVEFDPALDVISEAVLRITSNDAGRSPLDIDIRGVGTNDECPTAVGVCRIIESVGGFDTEINAAPLQNLECDATQSVGAGVAIAEYQWTVVERPTGSVAPFTPNPNVASPEFFIDLAGRYTLRLNVIDERGVTSCDPADVTVVAIPDETIHVQLTWHTPGDPDEATGGGADLDLHFVHMLGSVGHRTYDVHYLNRSPNWGGGLADPSLDIDDTNGAGPENINLDGPEVGGNYRVGAHYFSDHGFGASIATFRIYIEGVLQFELSRELLNTDDYWDAAEIRWDSGEVVRIDEVIPVCEASNNEFPNLGCQ